MTLLLLLAKHLGWLLVPFVFGTWTTPRTWIPGELVTAGQMNTHVRDNLNSLRSEHFGVQRFRGLHLRTHPDADVAATTVWAKADEVVMDDGTRLAFTTPVTALITAAGAGGLDTGSEAASTWYEVYTIAKDDGTKNLMLHRAKNYSVDTSFEVARDASRALRLATSTATDRLAQGIKFATSAAFHYIDVELVRAGAVSGRIWFSLQASSGGDASGTALATTDKIDASVISTSNQIIRIIFRTPTTPAAATQYHLVLEGDYTRSDTVHISWRGVAAGGYADGVAREYNGTAWANASGVGDFYFQAAIELNNAAVTMPTGYTKKSKVGYVFNNSSSNLRAFVAHDNVVVTDWFSVVSGVSQAVATLQDLRLFIPPTLVQLLGGVVGTVADDLFLFGVVPDGYGGESVLGRTYVTTPGSAGSLIKHIPDMPTEYVGVYLSRNNGTGTIGFWVRGYKW